MIIVVSDLHLGDELSNKAGFANFIEEYLKPRQDEITEVVLLGDILDLWRRKDTEGFLKNVDILNLICSLGFKVTYLVGNHDFLIIDLSKKDTNIDILQDLAQNLGTLNIGRSYQISSGDINYRFVHGHQMNYWYALPFYEAFCRAMCQVPISQSDEENAWTLMARENDTLSPLSIEKIEALSNSTRSQMMNQLAGPLQGNSKSILESMWDDLGLLREFADFEGYTYPVDQEIIIHNLREEINTLLAQKLSEPWIESWNRLLNGENKGTLKEVAKQFLRTWEDALQLSISNKMGNEESNNNRYISILRRCAASLLGLLNHDEFLVHGHSHSPYVDYQNRVADPGCWIGERSSFISIENGQIKSNYWRG